MNNLTNLLTCQKELLASVSNFQLFYTLYFFLFTFAFSNFTLLQAQETKTISIDSTQSANIKLPNSPQVEQGDVDFTDGSNSLLRITDEGTFGAIELKIGVPSATTNKLYNDAGTLKFNGSSLGSGGGASEINNLTDAKYDGTSLFLGNGAGMNDDATGNANTAVGKDALYSNSSGNNNTAHGFSSLILNTSGNNNTAIGYNSLYSNTTGIFNTASGSNALRYNTKGNNNTAIGYSALYWNTTGLNNTATGFTALSQNTTGSSNTAYGYEALNLNTTGGSNIANGTNSLRSNTTGSNNTANGFNSLFSNTTGEHNVANGHSALYTNSTGNNNAANGSNSLFSNTTGNFNTALGHGALYANTTGVGNVAIGFQAGFNNELGEQNTFIGNQAGRNTQTTNGSRNVFLGFKAGYKELGSDRLYIDNSDTDEPLIWGNFNSNLAAINGKLGIGDINSKMAPTALLDINAASTEAPINIDIAGHRKFKVSQNGGTTIGSNNTPPLNGLYVNGNTQIGGNTQIEGDTQIGGNTVLNGSTQIGTTGTPFSAIIKLTGTITDHYQANYQRAYLALPSGFNENNTFVISVKVGNNYFTASNSPSGPGGPNNLEFGNINIKYNSYGGSNALQVNTQSSLIPTGTPVTLIVMRMD